MTRVDLLSDTIYCEQAVKQLDQLLGDSNTNFRWSGRRSTV